MSYSAAEVENTMICSNQKIFQYYSLKIFEAFRAIMICFQGLLNSRVVSFRTKNQDTVISLEQRHSVKYGFHSLCASVRVIWFTYVCLFVCFFFCPPRDVVMLCSYCNGITVDSGRYTWIMNCRNETGMEGCFVLRLRANEFDVQMFPTRKLNSQWTARFWPSHNFFFII